MVKDVIIHIMRDELAVVPGAELRLKEGVTLPALFAPDPSTARRVIEFFTANIRNPHTRRAYAKAAAAFAAWCEDHGLAQLRDVQPVHVAAYVEELQGRVTAPTVKPVSYTHLTLPTNREV